MGEVGVRLTGRDRELLLALVAARWLSTAQAGSLCFPGVTSRVLQRRLRLLRSEGYLKTVRAHPMAEALHALGPKGRDAVLVAGWSRPVSLERAPPINLEHFLGVNDIRIAVEGGAAREGIAVRFFYACWELQQRGWSYPVVPDAAARLEYSGRETTAVFEYDRGKEPAEFVLRTKFVRYAEGLDGFPISAVAVIAESESRLERLRELVARRLAFDCDKFSFITKTELGNSWRLASLLA